MEEGACACAQRLSLPVLDGKLLQAPLEHCHLSLDGFQLRLLNLIAQCLVRTLHKQIALAKVYLAIRSALKLRLPHPGRSI